MIARAAEMRDQTAERTWRMSFDRAEQLMAVNETWEPGKDTMLRYDGDGNLKARWTDGRVDTSQTPDGYASGKKTRLCV